MDVLLFALIHLVYTGKLSYSVTLSDERKSHTILLISWGNNSGQTSSGQDRMFLQILKPFSALVPHPHLCPSFRTVQHMRILISCRARNLPIQFAGRYENGMNASALCTKSFGRLIEAEKGYKDGAT